MDLPVAAREQARSQHPSPITAEGLATGAFLAIRGKEECYRSQRYRRPLTLVVVRLDRPDPASEQRLQNFLRAGTRASDIGACLGQGVYALLLPETDARSAASLIQRMTVDVPLARAASASVPDDGIGWDEIFHKASHRT